MLITLSVSGRTAVLSAGKDGRRFCLTVPLYSQFSPGHSHDARPRTDFTACLISLQNTCTMLHSSPNTLECERQDSPCRSEGALEGALLAESAVRMDGKGRVFCGVLGVVRTAAAPTYISWAPREGRCRPGLKRASVEAASLKLRPTPCGAPVSFDPDSSGNKASRAPLFCFTVDLSLGWHLGFSVRQKGDSPGARRYESHLNLGMRETKGALGTDRDSISGRATAECPKGAGVGIGR